MPMAVIARLARRLKDSRGGIAISFAAVLPALFAVVGLASDYAMLSKLRGELQVAADAAAIAGAREIPVAKTNTAQIILLGATTSASSG